jgi:hypothetical protein
MTEQGKIINKYNFHNKLAFSFLNRFATLRGEKVIVLLPVDSVMYIIDLRAQLVRNIVTYFSQPL